jgi:hypothetical protein
VSLGSTDPGAQAVVMGPSGLWFNLPVTIAVTPTEAVPLERQVMFTFSDDGAAMWAAEPQVGTEEMVFVADHFTGFGFLDLGKVARDASNWAVERYVSWTTTNEAERISAQFAQAIGEERQRQLLGIEESGVFDPEFLDGLMEEYLEKVIKPRVANAGTSCAAAQEAIRTVLGFSRQQQLLGLPDQGGLDELLTGSGLFDTAYAVCEKEAIERCQKAKDPTILVTFWIGAERQAALLGAQSKVNDSDMGAEARKICGTPGYEADGFVESAPAGTTISGRIKDLSEPFRLKTSGDIVGTIDFTPDGPDAGTLTSKGAFPGVPVKLKGTGTYTVTLEPDGKTGTLTMQWQLTGFVAGTSAGGSGPVDVTLTAVSD